MTDRAGWVRELGEYAWRVPPSVVDRVAEGLEELEALAPGHVINIWDASADHAILMNLPSALQEIAGILGIPF